MKSICLFFMIVFFSGSEIIFSIDSSKHVIGGRVDGFFSNFLAVLNHLQWCVKNKKTPVVYWSKEGHYYDPRGCNGIISDNIWEYYFYPVSHLKYEPGDKVYYSPNSPDHFGIATHPHTSAPYPDKDMRHYMHQFIAQFIKIKEPTLNKIEDFYRDNIEGKFTVSIHIRGTDKYTEVPPIPLDYIFQEANKYTPCQFFIATDEERILNEAKKKLRGKIVYYNSFRIRSPGVHYSNSYPAELSRAYLGEEALIDSILLSRCDLLIHTWSNLSIAALLFNPDIKHVHLGK